MSVTKETVDALEASCRDFDEALLVARQATAKRDEATKLCNQTMAEVDSSKARLHAAQEQFRRESSGESYQTSRL